MNTQMEHANTKFTIFLGGVLPGTVTAFSGSFDSNGYPIDKNTGKSDTDWHLCDGTNGTPDLRSRFIYGGDGTNNGATGGEATHKLTVEEMPSHNHSIRFYNDDWNSSDGKQGAYNLPGIVHDATDTSDKHTNRWTDIIENTGSDQPHNNMPPYYTLAFIMKL